MFRIHIIATGKLKDSYSVAAVQEYIKRLQPYAKVVVDELPEEPLGKTVTPEQIKAKEAERMKKRFPENATIVALDETGQEYTSVELAHFIEAKVSDGTAIAFVIGGPLGLDPSILKEADAVVSLSRLTLTHQMVRPLLLEQIYRAVTIINGKKYHY